MTVTPIEAAGSGRRRSSTSTSAFGSSRREAHDSSAFYERFVPPELSRDESIEQNDVVDVIYAADARDMIGVASDSVALVVTSPPYFAGKQYELELGVGAVPANYFQYLELLRDVFAECKRVLEPGGRIAVNVANLGRRPYRSLSGDVTQILQDLGLLLRGEVIWLKGRAAGGSCAWGTFQRPSNPVLRDVTERIVIASKGRFDRALTPTQRAKSGLPSTATISRDEFMEATTDIWEIAPESATRVGHPAPFPIELPKRLIDLYTYEGDVVLDPFMGSGTTAVAAVQTARRYIGFDTDSTYKQIAERRIAGEREKLARPIDKAASFRAYLPAVEPADSGEDFQARAVREGRQARELAKSLLEQCGFREIHSEVKPRGLGVVINFVVTDRNGDDWAFDVSGAFTSSRAGLRRTDTLWKALGKAAVLHQAKANAEPGGIPRHLVLLTTDLPEPGSAGFLALRGMVGKAAPIYDVIELMNPEHHERLRAYAEGIDSNP
jgi:site-specific DNA-methyltransferase (adenine-specific)